MNLKLRRLPMAMCLFFPHTGPNVGWRAQTKQVGLKHMAGWFCVWLDPAVTNGKTTLRTEGGFPVYINIIVEQSWSGAHVLTEQSLDTTATTTKQWLPWNVTMDLDPRLGRTRQAWLNQHVWWISKNWNHALVDVWGSHFDLFRGFWMVLVGCHPEVWRTSSCSELCLAHGCFHGCSHGALRCHQPVPGYCVTKLGVGRIPMNFHHQFKGRDDENIAQEDWYDIGVT